ncbi:MAG TPA: hypothetical protein VLT57_04100 [Bryobacteraceae bacterium]|nr:hypothetical protein [Bryobacteraceae bacterium]
MPAIDVPLQRGRFGQTSRRDLWWVQPLIVFAGLSAFLVYATWAAFQGDHFRFGPYLSPFYSPELFGSTGHAWFGAKPAWIPAFVPFTAALVILPFPAGFRVTCYYYRGAYYKAFWADPPSCAVGEPRSKYLGERSFPLILQNIHRYFLYVALLFLIFLAHDAWSAFRFTDASGVKHFGMGVGSFVLTLNVVLLGGYTFGCHSLRHLAGGMLDRISASPLRKRAYDCSSCLNSRHMYWAWCSLVWVAFSDVYVRLCSLGVWTDWRIF